MLQYSHCEAVAEIDQKNKAFDDAHHLLNETRHNDLYLEIENLNLNSQVK